MNDKDPFGCGAFQSGCLLLILFLVGAIAILGISGFPGREEHIPPDNVVYAAVPHKPGSGMNIKRVSFPSDKYPAGVSEDSYPAAVMVYSVSFVVVEATSIGDVYEVYWIYFYKANNQWLHSKPEESLPMSSLDEALSKEPREP